MQIGMSMQGYRMVSSFFTFVLSTVFAGFYISFFLFVLRIAEGIENVRKHLEEVDNVPLLVSLYTDVTEDSTIDMVKSDTCYTYF